MNGKIHILPEQVMKRIAAGEVVERPASVVKELVENALDAGASSVTVVLKGGGLERIQVTDDGEGMSEADAMACTRRHATSKIARAEDLEDIRTLGFRGEALASIGSVSRMEIITRREKDAEATQVVLENGEIRDVLKAGAPTGTSVIVKDLFAFVPARRKFLKSPPAELRHAVTSVRRLALSHPATGFSLFIEGDKVLDAPPESLRDRVRRMLGEEKAARLVPVRGQSPGLGLEGFVHKPGMGGRTRDDQFFFINRRFFQSRNLLHAVSSAYGTRLSHQEFPFFILFLEMDPSRFDANVHPTKIEVRFADDRFLHDQVRHWVDEALKSPESAAELRLVTGPRGITPAGRRSSAPPDYGQLSLAVQVQTPAPGSASDGEKPGRTEEPAFWQIQNRYILSRIHSGLILIDQHVAHERILYEQAMKSMAERGGLSQQMLFPSTVELSPDDYLALTEILPALQRIGFGIREFGRNTVVIESVPVEVRGGDEKSLLAELISQYREEASSGEPLYECIAKAYSCKSAVKAGEKLSAVEMESLVDRLFAAENPYFCPHGRPVVVNLTIQEIDRRFGRNPQ
ncbi:DNA mismatch repair endonuclease MutL [bacterium]|nr:DNA mismatch repair endonuclease MutL [bacterium]